MLTLITNIAKKLFSLLAEFSTYVNNPELFSRKLCECAEIFYKK